MHNTSQATRHSLLHTLKVIAAFAAIYLVWGGTFLAIHFAIASIPPLLMAGFRCLIAGGLLLLWVLLRDRKALQWRVLPSALISGFFFFVLSQGMLGWAEQTVPSGVAAVFLALIPIWIVVLEWLRPGGQRPNRMTMLGVGLGFVGLIILAAPDLLAKGGTLTPVNIGALILSAFGWAAGSVYSRIKSPQTSLMALSAMQMLSGGVMLLLLGSARGEWPMLLAGTMTTNAMLGLLYLSIVGSLLTFSAYIWLLQVSSPTLVSTYAFVNPVVAVFLGWLLANEQLTPEILIAAGIIVVAVVLITTFQHPHVRKSHRQKPEESALAETAG